MLGLPYMHMAENVVISGLELLYFQLQQSYFGIPLQNIANFLIVAVVSAIVGKLAVLLFRHHFSILAKKTSNKFDDLILDSFSSPLFYFFMLAGLFIGFQLLELEGFSKSIGTNIFISVFFALLAWLIFNLIEGTVKYYVRPFTEKTDSNLDDQLLPVLVKVSKISVLALFAVIVLVSWGNDVTALIAGLGIVGLAVAFAAQQTIADIFGGISIFTSRPFKVGDFIGVGSNMGLVEEVGLRYTRLRTVEQRLVTIPNREVAGGAIINYSQVPKRGQDIKIGLTYGTSSKKLSRAMELLKEIVNKADGCEKN